MKIHIKKVGLHRPGENAANAMRNVAGIREKEKISAHGQLESDRRSFGIELLLSSCWTEGKKQRESLQGCCFHPAAGAGDALCSRGIVIEPFHAVSHNSNNDNDIIVILIFYFLTD